MAIESLLTHFVCLLIGGMIGVTAMAMCAASGRADDEEQYGELFNEKTGETYDFDKLAARLEYDERQEVDECSNR